MTSAPFVAVPSKILYNRIGFDGMSKEYVTIFKTKEDGLIASDRLIVVMSEDEMKAACPKFLQRGTTKEENAPLPIHEILVKDDSSRKESDEFTSTMNTELVKDIEAVNSLQLLVDSAPRDEKCTKCENASKGDCPGKESDLLTDNMNVELRQDVERAVKRLRLLLDNAPSPNTDKFLSKHLAILNEYSSMSCISACFLECGAVEVLINILNRTSTSHYRLQQSAGSVLFHLTGSRTDKSVGTEILGQVIREATLNKGEKVKSRLAKQDIVFKIFGHLHPNDPNLELMTSLPCVTSSFAYSLVKDYVSCLLISEKVMGHSQGLFPPLLVPSSSELLPLKDVQESVDLKSSFALFGLLSRVILRMVKILNWRRPEDQRVAARRRTSILSISRKSARRKNVYKSRKNFTTDQEYSDYVKSTLKPGMSVICIQAYVNVHIGDIGKFISANTYYPPLTIKWDSLGTNVGVPYGSVQILPNYSQEAVSKEDKARNMPREVSSLNLQDSGFSTSQERLTLQHWWELLCAVQELPVEKQSKVCGMLRVKEFEDLLSVQPTMMEVCAVLKYLKMHHPEGIWREFSVQMLSSYWTVSQERSPHEVARVFEEEWGQGMKSVVSIDRFFTSRMVEDSDRFLVINIITAQYNGRGGYHPDWVIQNVLDFIYRYHGGSVTRMADMRSALLSACVDNCRLSIATNLFISSNAFSKIQITEVFIALWIMKLIVSRNSNQLDKMASSGSFSFVLYLIEMSKGSPLMQCYGLLCIHAHFANCKSRELLWINNSSIHGRKMRSQKKPSPVEPLIAELARCTGEPTQGHRNTLSHLEAHSGSLKSFLEAVGDVTRSSKGSGLPWQKSFFRSGVENSLHVLNALVQRGGKMVVARLMAWGFLSVVKEVFEVFPGVDARFALETAMKQLCETTSSDPNAKKRRTENCSTSTVRKNNDFDDFLYAFVNGALDVKYIGEIMKFLTVHLGVTGSSTDKPCVVKSATVANKDRARMFVTNGGTVRLLEMVCGGSVSPLDAKMVLQLIVALLNISEEVCDEIVNHGLVRALLILMESLCKTAHLVACYVLCIIHKLATNNEYLLVMKDEAMTTSLKDMKKSRPEYESSITTLCTTISSVGFMVQENCTESAACVLLELNKAIVNTLANSRIARDVPAIPHLSSYLTVLTEGNESLHTLSQGRCWYLMEVSDCDYAKNQLLDNNPSTFWESYQSHWIKLYMHTGCIIRKLTVDVSNSDRRYMPKTITVEGGGSGQLKELSTVSIPLEANGTFVLLEDQTESYSVIRVCVKESHSGLNEVRLRGLHCTCLSLSMWPQFVSSLRTGMQVSSSISVSTWMKKKLDPLELYDRMFAALVHQQKVADAYFLTSMAREELGQICRQTLIKPTIEGILRGQGEGSIEEALEAYISSTDVPVNCALAFFSWSASHSQPSMLPQLPSSSLMEQDGEMKRMSRIRQLCRVLFECILSLSNSDSDSAHASAKDCFRILEKFWCNVVSNQLRPAFLKISSRPNSLGESVSEYMRVVDKLRMIVCELFSGDARLLNRLYAVSCGRFPAPVAMEDIIRFHVAVNTHLNALLECPATSESDATLSQLATQLLGAGDEAMKMFECTYRYFLCQRLLQGKSSSLSLEKSHLSSFSNVCRENLCQKVLRDVERSIELAEAFSMSAPHGPVDTSPLQWSNVCESALAPSVVEEQRRRALYRQGVLSVLVLTPLFWPVKFLQVNDPVYLPNPLRSFCKDYQQFFTHSYSRRVTSHERPPKLKWTLSGWAIVDHNGQLYKVSTAQLIVLLQFNSKDAVTSSTLVASAGFSSELFDRVIRSLVVGPVPLLREAPHSSIESSTYSLNPVACARTRQSSSVVNVAHEDDGDVGMTAIVGHNSSVIAKSFKSREATLDCAVIQVMKEEKRATVDTVISKVLQSVREGTLSDAGDKFECSHGNVFGRIEHLVSVGYLQYDDNLSHVIVYSEEFNERRNPAVTISGQKYSGQKRKSMMGRGSPCVKRRKSAFSSSSSSCMPSLPLWFLPTPGVSIAGNYNQSRIQLYISTIVEEVAEALVLEAYEAEILLHHCKWNKDRLLHLSSSDYKLTSLLAEAGLTCSEDVPLASSSENGCPVCLRPLLEPLSLDCNHNCCRDCWMGHLTSQFSFSQILNAKCPIPKCNLTCTSCFVDTVFDNDQEISTKFKNALVASFIDHSEDFKWCSNPKGCSSIVRKTPGHISGPCQTCGWVSCFKCSFMEGHEPATCSDMVTWVQGGGYYKYMSEEQKSRQLEMLISKKCPKCYVSIEKNDGCLHMMCRCGHDFCWRCLKPWKPLHKDYYRCTIAISREAVKHHKLSEYNAKCTELLKSSEQMLELKDNVEITHAVSGVPLAQFNFMLDACSVLASSYKMLAYAYVADYYKSASDQWDCLPILSQSMSKEARLLQGFLDIVLCEGKDVARISEVHLNEGRQLVRNLERTKEKILLGAKQRYALSEDVMPRAGLNTSNTSAQGRNLYGSSTEREKTPESSSFPVEAFFDTNAAGVSSHFGLLPSVLSMSQSKPQPTSSGTETIPAVLSEEDDVDTIYDDDDDDDMDSEYSDLYAEDYMCVCGQCN